MHRPPIPRYKSRTPEGTDPMIRLSTTAAVIALASLIPLRATAEDAAGAHLKALIGGSASKKRATPPAKANSAALLSGGKDEDATPAAAPAPVPPKSDADRALLKALLFAFQPAPREIRAIAIEDLALLGDRRAIDVLADLAFHPDPVIAAAAVRAIGHFQDRRAEDLLIRVAEKRTFPIEIRTAAIDALPFQATLTAHAALRLLAGASSEPSAIQQAARKSADAMTLPGPPTSRR
ncbi:MAG: HEAT repeat domain-containing protein [Myxococcaceae bacterium]|nr:HEAT repeat domain-containing protein [Myxococcaceae bacterium]